MAASLTQSLQAFFKHPALQLMGKGSSPEVTDTVPVAGTEIFKLR